MLDKNRSEQVQSVPFSTERWLEIYGCKDYKALNLELVPCILDDSACKSWMFVTQQDLKETRIQLNPVKLVRNAYDKVVTNWPWDLGDKVKFGLFSVQTYLETGVALGWMQDVYEELDRLEKIRNEKNTLIAIGSVSCTNGYLNVSREEDIWEIPSDLEREN